MGHGIIFDIDGLLVDTRPHMVGTYNEMFTSLKKPKFTEAKMYGFSSGDYKDMMRKIDMNKGHAYGILKEKWLRNLKTNKYGIREYEGASSLVAYFKEKCPVMFATGSHRHQLELYALHLPLVRHILEDGSILTRDDVLKPKPDQSHFVQCMKKMGSKASQTVVVDDMPDNLISAQRIGMQAVGVTWGFSYREKFEEAGISCVDTFQELKTIIDGML